MLRSSCKRKVRTKGKAVTNERKPIFGSRSSYRKQLWLEPCPRQLSSKVKYIKRYIYIYKYICMYKYIYIHIYIYIFTYISSY